MVLAVPDVAHSSAEKSERIRDDVGTLLPLPSQ